ncbi:cutinase family protein [Nocardia macrotermitis]|uniref:cutinase family protein n=1 Tax=Nocardia macrotermitis TaxID=2585198 RepID=UPI001885F2F8|nr:cutinase family protein [Nocardia macrotermitis]
MVLLVTFALVMVGVVPGVAAADTRSGAEASGCPAVTGVFVRGTWEDSGQKNETVPVGLLAPVATQLAQRFGSRFAFRFPAYPAAAFNGTAYGDSKVAGVAATRRVLQDFAKRCPATKFVIAGYSQGGDVAGDVAASIGCSGDPVPADRVLGVGIIADPHRDPKSGKLVGPAVNGTGIGGARAGGFCKLAAATAEICADGDLYCSTDIAQHPVLGALGRLLSQPTQQSDKPDTSGGTPEDGTSAEVQSLVAPVGDMHLDAVPGAVQQLVAQFGSGHPDSAQVTHSVDSLTGTLRSLANLAARTAGNPDAQSRLASAAPGTSDRLAGQVLNAASHSDLKGALDSLADIGSQVAGVAAGRSGGDLAGAVNRVSSATAPLSSSLSNSPAEVLNSVSQVLGVLKPSTVVDQVTNVAENGLRFAANVPHVLDVLNRMIGLIGDPKVDVPGKVRGLHDLCGQLNTAFEPLVKLAANVDLHTISHLIAMIPDTSGTAQIVSILVDLLGNLDVPALAAQVGRLQENLWNLLQALTTGANPAEILTRAADFVPTLLGFATVAVNTLTGAPKSGDQSGGQDVSGAAKAVTDKLSGQGLDSASELASEGFSAASFFASGVHQDYGKYVVDGQGRTATQWLTDWFGNRIRSLGAA